MSLNASNFVTLGPIKSADLMQFVNLFTGVMTDQPVTFKNAMLVGGTQGASTAPLKLFGVTNQSGNLIELYPTTASSNPTFGFGALGNFAWGPGSPAANDTFLSRVALQNGHVTDTAGLLVEPYLEVKGNVRADGWNFTNGATIVSPAANPFTLVLNQTLAFTSLNSRVHSMATNGAGISMESLDSWSQAAGQTGILIAANVYYDGAHWNRMNNAAAVAHLNFSAGAMQYLTAPAAVGIDPPWTSALSVDSAGNTSVGGALSGAVLVARGRQVQISDGNCYIISDTSSNMFIRGSALYVQNAAGSPTPVIALSFSAAGGANLDSNVILCSTSGNVLNHGAYYAGWGLPSPAVFSYGGAGLGVITGSLNVTGGLGVQGGGVTTAGSVSIPVNQSFNSGGPMVWWDGASTVIQNHSSGTRWVNSANSANLMTLGEDGKLTIAHDIQITPPSVLNLGAGAGGAIVSPGTNIGRSGDTVYLSAHAYVFFDLGVGHVITCQQVIQTSDPELKNSATLFDDASCMARIRDTSVHVYRYQLDPPSPIPPGPPQPTPTQFDMGMMAPEVFASSPEFVATDVDGHAVGVNYANMASMLWGALRQLDARCVAKGI